MIKMNSKVSIKKKRFIKKLITLENFIHNFSYVYAVKSKGRSSKKKTTIRLHLYFL